MHSPLFFILINCKILFSGTPPPDPSFSVAPTMKECFCIYFWSRASNLCTRYTIDFAISINTLNNCALLVLLLYGNDAVNESSNKDILPPTTSIATLQTGLFIYFFIWLFLSYYFYLFFFIFILLNLFIFIFISFSVKGFITVKFKNISTTYVLIYISGDDQREFVLEVFCGWKIPIGIKL